MLAGCPMKWAIVKRFRVLVLAHEGQTADLSASEKDRLNSKTSSQS
jgi:hypothetical protein